MTWEKIFELNYLYIKENFPSDQVGKTIHTASQFAWYKALNESPAQKWTLPSSFIIHLIQVSRYTAHKYKIFCTVLDVPTSNPVLRLKVVKN